MSLRDLNVTNFQFNVRPRGVLIRPSNDCKPCLGNPTKRLECASARSKVRYFYNKIDLNGDGKPEFVVMMLGPACCGSGGCPGFVVEPAANGYRVLSYIPLANGSIIVSDHKTRGWRDLIMYAGSHGVGPHFCIRPWNGAFYPVGTVITMKKGEKINGTALLTDDLTRQPGIKLEPSNRESDWNQRRMLVQQQIKNAALLGEFATYEHCAQMSWSLHSELTRNAHDARIILQAANAVILDGDPVKAQELLKHLPPLYEGNTDEQMMKEWADRTQIKISTRERK